MSEQQVSNLVVEVAKELPNMPLIDIIKFLSVASSKLKETKT